MVQALPRQHDIESDGRGGYLIRNMPILVDHERSFPGPGGRPRKVVVDDRRLQRIASNINRRHREDGYRSAAHEEHTDKAARNTRLAYSQNARVDRAMFEGRPRHVLFVDLAVETPEQLERIKALPYRSVEVNYTTDDLSSLALMESEGPYFKFPNPEYRERVDVGSQSYADDAMQLVGAAADGDLYRVLYRCKSAKGYQAMPDTKEQKKDSEMVNASQATAPPVKGDGEGTKSEKKAPPEMVSVPKREYQDMKKQLDDMKPYMAKFKKYMDDAELDEDDDKDDESPVVKNSDIDALEFYADADMDVRAELAMYRGRVERLEASVAKMLRSNEEDSLTGWARDELSGLSLPANFEDEVRRLYRARGADAVKTYVESAQRYGTPAESYADSDAEDYGSAEIPEAVARYRGADANTFRMANDLYAEWQNQHPAVRRAVGAEAYIQNHMPGASSYA